MRPNLRLDTTTVRPDILLDATAPALSHKEAAKYPALC